MMEMIKATSAIAPSVVLNSGMIMEICCSLSEAVETLDVMFRISTKDWILCLFPVFSSIFVNVSLSSPIHSSSFNKNDPNLQVSGSWTLLLPKAYCFTPTRTACRCE